MRRSEIEDRLRVCARGSDNECSQKSDCEGRNVLPDNFAMVTFSFPQYSPDAFQKHADASASHGHCGLCLMLETSNAFLGMHVSEQHPPTDWRQCFQVLVNTPGEFSKRHCWFPVTETELRFGFLPIVNHRRSCYQLDQQEGVLRFRQEAPPAAESPVSASRGLGVFGGGRIQTSRLVVSEPGGDCVPDLLQVCHRSGGHSGKQ